MGLIGTRSLDTQIPGINELVKSAEGNIRNGIDAYDALQTIRKARPMPRFLPRHAWFENNGANLGYALLLKRYVDDPARRPKRRSTRRQWIPCRRGAAVLDLPHHGGPGHVLHRADRHLLLAGCPPQA
jgi:hypothetical protein